MRELKHFKEPPLNIWLNKYGVFYERLDVLSGVQMEND